MADEGVALWDAAGDDDAQFQKELDGEAEEPTREHSGGHDSGKKQRSHAREERRLDGADYLSRHGLSHTGAPAARAASPDQSGPPKAVYISGLTWWTTDIELEALASQFGTVERVKFFEDKVNGKSKGYALVEFANPEAAIACKDGIQGRLLHGKQPVVAFPPPASAGDAGGAAGARGAADAQQRWPQQPPAWQPPNAGRGGPQWGAPPPGWRGPPSMGGPYPPWGGPGRGGPFPGAMGMMPGYGPMPGNMMAGYRPPYYAGDGRQEKEKGRDNGDGDREKDRKKRHRDDEPKEKSRRRDRRSRSRSRSR